MKALFIFRGGMAKKAILNRQNSPKDFLYGMNEIRLKNWQADYLIAPKDPRKEFLRKLTNILEMPFSLITKVGLPIDIYPMHKKQIDNSHAIVCINDAIGLGILFWKLIGILRPKVVIIAQSLTERQKYFGRLWPVKEFVKKLLSKADMVLVLSSVAQKNIVKELKVPNYKAKVFKFGIDVRFWSPPPNGSLRKSFLLTVGNDMNRDFNTLVAALPPKCKLIAVTNHNITSTDRRIERLRNITDIELRDLYRTCAAVVVPSKFVETESSGLSVSLQARACGAKVITSYSPALLDYFPKSSDTFKFYHPEDPKDLKMKIEETLHSAKDEPTNQHVTFSTKEMARQMERVLRSIILN